MTKFKYQEIGNYKIVIEAESQEKADEIFKEIEKNYIKNKKDC